MLDNAVRGGKKMSKYTTGEIAKLCEVTVRTVQYYDQRGLLIPSELSEGGRRLYSDQDLIKMKIITYLRELDFPIDCIIELFSEESPEKVIEMLIANQTKQLQDEIAEQKEKLSKLTELRAGLDNVREFSVESISDIVYVMSNRKKLTKIRAVMIAIDIPLEIAEVCSFIYGIVEHNWWPFAAVFILAIPICILMTRYYVKSCAYICPKCHNVFQPKVKETLFARHTPNTRLLTCPACGYHNFCIETINPAYDKADAKEEK